MSLCLTGLVHVAVHYYKKVLITDTERSPLDSKVCHTHAHVAREYFVSKESSCPTEGHW